MVATWNFSSQKMGAERFLCRRRFEVKNIVKDLRCIGSSNEGI